MTEGCTIGTCRCTLSAPLLLFRDLPGPCRGHLEAASVSCVGILTFWRRDSSPAGTRWQQLTRRNRSIDGVELSLAPRVSPLHNYWLLSCEGPKRTVGVDVAVSCLIGNVQFNLHIHLRSSSKSYSEDYTTITEGIQRIQDLGYVDISKQNLPPQASVLILAMTFEPSASTQLMSLSGHDKIDLVLQPMALSIFPNI